MLTEEQIIKGCQRRKKDCQFELVRRYSGMLMTVCRRYAHDEAGAKDILQETFMKIFKGVDKYKPTGSFEAWMRKIAVRCALQWLQMQKIRFAPFNPDEGEAFSEEPEIFGALEMESVISEIQGLTNSLRVVFNLNVIEGYSHKEIAGMLQISESSSRVHLARARAILQQRLNARHSVKYRSV